MCKGSEVWDVGEIWGFLLVELLSMSKIAGRSTSESSGGFSQELLLQIHERRSQERLGAASGFSSLC